MNKRIGAILEQLNDDLASLPGVFSTPQWGGRAYKLPDANGKRSKPKLVAHVSINKAGDAIGVSFKLDRARAEEVVDRHGDWIQPHSFRTLAPSGWVSARVTKKTQVRVLAKLLAESHSQYPQVDLRSTETASSRRSRAGATTQIDRVMGELKAEGLAPAGEFDF